MSTRLRSTIFAGAAFAALGLAPPASAQTTVEETITPTLVMGAPNCLTQAVIDLCDLINPIRFTINPPNSVALTTFTKTLPEGDLVIDITRDGSSFGFLDTSLDGTSTESQQVDVGGVDGGGPDGVLVFNNANNANVYCRTNWKDDTGLAPISGKLNKIEFCYNTGPCLKEQSLVATACTDFNTSSGSSSVESTVDALQGWVVTADPPLNFCGCTNKARFCDPAVPSNEEGACDSSGAGFAGITTEGVITTGNPGCNVYTFNGRIYRFGPAC